MSLTIELISSLSPQVKINDTIFFNLKYLLTAFAFLSLLHAKAQLNVSKQLSTIPANVTQYFDGYLHDMTFNQRVVYLNGMHTTGKDLGKWELNLSLTAGSVLTSAYVINPDYTKNFELRGASPSLFGDGSDGQLFFQLIDEANGAGMSDPFTGDEIGFAIPLLPGTNLGMGISPAIMPVVSMGIGYGTEVSAGILPGVLKAASKSLTGDFKIDKDLLYSVGIRHDVFHWIPQMAKRNFRLTVGATYNKMTVGAVAGKGLFNDFTNINSKLLSATNNLSGVEYGFNSLGFEAMLSKKLSFIDLSLFASSNASDYYIQSEGNVVVTTAKSFYPNRNEGTETTTLENLVDIKGTTSRLIYGAAVQLNFGRLYLGAKYGSSDQAYVSASLGFKLLKEKKKEE